MSIFRPSNLNKRLTGTPNRSPGNGGQIGPVNTPYNRAPAPGNRFTTPGKSGKFSLKESACGVREKCAVSLDCAGFVVYCCSGSAILVAPRCTEISAPPCLNANAVTCANNTMGCCGWFYPNRQQLVQSYFCRSFWDLASNATYLAEDGVGWMGGYGYCVNFTNGTTGYVNRNSGVGCIRTFRCVTY